MRICHVDVRMYRSLPRLPQVLLLGHLAVEVEA